MKQFHTYKLLTDSPLNPKVRKLIEEIVSTVLIASDPYDAVRRSLVINSSKLTVVGSQQQLDISQGILLCSLGKAARLMAKAATDLLGEKVISGVIIENAVDDSILFPQTIHILQGDHPIPGAKSLAAGQALQDLLCAKIETIPVLFLISGGGSSLMILPSNGISLSDLRILNQVLLGHHLSIDEINTIRKHIDATKGGGLLRWLGNSPSISLVLSDVISGDLSMVASGPTTSDSSTFYDAFDIIEKHDLVGLIPQSIKSYLLDGSVGRHLETVKYNDDCAQNTRTVEIGSLRQVISEVEKSVRLKGWKPIIQRDWLIGTVESAAERLLMDIHELYGNLHQTVLIYGGETTVQPAGKGMGGRNTHLALLATETIQKYPGVSLFTLATDGVDGNSPASGAIVDSKTYTKAMQKGIDISYHHKEYDSFSFFQRLNDALITGPTGTNVNDLVIVLFE